MDTSAFLAAIVETSYDAIVGKTLDGTVVSWNRAAERMFGYGAEEMIGQSVRRLIPADRQQEEDRILASIARGERIAPFETVRLRKDGSEIRLSVAVSPVRDAAGRIVAASKIARDLSETRQLREQLADSESRFHLLADNISQFAWIADATGAIYWYNKRWYDYTGTTFEQMRGWGWKAVHHPDHIERVVARIQHSFDTGEPWEDTFPLRGADGEYRWFLSRALPVRDEAGRIVCWFGTNTDITAQRSAELRNKLLLMEISHRSKNLMAQIQALARTTAAQGGDFVTRLNQRLSAMAANQDLLVRHAWSAIPVVEMIDTQLAFLGESAAQLSRTGPDIRLGPQTAEVLSMAINELATNALKYGALSVPGGRVGIQWAMKMGADGERFTMSWRESGGPAVEEPQRKGVGTLVMKEIPRRKFGGDLQLEYAPSGVVWSLDCPAAKVLE